MDAESTEPLPGSRGSEQQCEATWLPTLTPENADKLVEASVAPAVNSVHEQVSQRLRGQLPHMQSPRVKTSIKPAHVTTRTFYSRQHNQSSVPLAGDVCSAHTGGRSTTQHGRRGAESWWRMPHHLIQAAGGHQHDDAHPTQCAYQAPPRSACAFVRSINPSCR